MSTTVLVEPDPGGHRFQAVANVARVASRTGDVVLLTSRGARSDPAYAVFLADAGLVVLEELEAIAPSTQEVVTAVAGVCRERDVATVVVMEADHFLTRWWYVAPRALRGLPRPPRVVFMVTRYPTRVAPSDLAGWRLRTAKAGLTLLARATRSLDRAAGFAGRDDTSRGWVVKRTRDPDLCSAHSRDRADLRRRLGLDLDRRLVGIYGVITVGKHPALVWEALQREGLAADLVLAGSLTPEVAAWVRELPESDLGRVIVRDGFLPDEELDALVAAADVVALAMTHNGPSGIQGKALAAGVPVVTAGSRVRARELRATRAGETAELTVDSLGPAFRRALDRGPDATTGNGVPPATAEEFACSLLGVDATGSPTRRRVRRTSLSG